MVLAATAAEWLNDCPLYSYGPCRTGSCCSLSSTIHSASHRLSRDACLGCLCCCPSLVLPISPRCLGPQTGLLLSDGFDWTNSSQARLGLFSHDRHEKDPIRPPGRYQMDSIRRIDRMWLVFHHVAFSQPLMPCNTALLFPFCWHRRFTSKHLLTCAGPWARAAGIPTAPGTAPVVMVRV